MDKKLWFRAKRYGLGWYPVSWQGWVVLLMYVFAILTKVIYLNNHEHSVSDFLIQFLPQLFILTVFLIMICYAYGEKPRWRWGKETEEMVDVFNEQGEKTGKVVPKSEAHQKGYIHIASAVYIVNAKNEVLLQLRCSKKQNRPNMWDTSASGHVPAGESFLAAAVRETEEELGIRVQPDELLYIGTARVEDVLNGGTYFDNEFDAVYVLNRDIAIEDFILQKEEVAEVRWVPYTEFKQRVISADPTLCSRHLEYQLFIHYFEKIRGTHKN